MDDFFSRFLGDQRAGKGAASRNAPSFVPFGKAGTTRHDDALTEAEPDCLAAYAARRSLTASRRAPVWRGGRCVGPTGWQSVSAGAV